MTKTSVQLGRRPSLAEIDLTKVEPTKVVLTIDEFSDDVKRLMTMFFNNQFEEAVEGIQLYSETSVLHALALSMLNFMQMMLTMSKSQIESVSKKVARIVERIEKRRYVRSYKNLLLQPNYNDFTDDECQAEIAYVLSNLIYACMTILHDQSVVGVINAGLKMNSAWRTQNECFTIRKQKTNWISEKAKNDFDACCDGIGGTFGIILSLFPPKLSKLLEYIGFNCDQKHAINLLADACKSTDLLSYQFASFFIVVTQGSLEYAYGLGEENSVALNNISDTWTKRCPKGAITHMINGINQMHKANFEVAVNHFKRMIDEQDYWPQLHFAAHIAMSLCHVVLDDVDNGLISSASLRDKCKWSQSMFTYLHCIFLQAKAKTQTSEEQAASLKLLAEQLKLIPSLKRKLGGLHVFHEELCISRSKKYHDNIDELILPHLELIYFWNLYKMMEGNKQVLENKLKLIKDEQDLLEKDENGEITNKEIHYYLMFHKAVIYKHLHNPIESETMLQEVIKGKKVLKFNNYLVPASWFELSKIKYDQGEWKESKKCLKKVNNFNGYMGDGLIKYRTNLMNEKLKNQTKDPEIIS